VAYLGDPQLWFESFQNWQSEFLSTGRAHRAGDLPARARLAGSKPVGAPVDETGT
jgi:hypothetical protein